MDTTKLSYDKSKLDSLWPITDISSHIRVTTVSLVEIATLVRENEKTRIRILGEKEVTELIKQYDDEQAKIEAEKVAKEKATQQMK